MLEHDPAVITVSKRAGADTNLLASPEHLASIGVDLERTDRGGMSRGTALGNWWLGQSLI